MSYDQSVLLNPAGTGNWTLAQLSAYTATLSSLPRYGTLAVVTDYLGSLYFFNGSTWQPTSSKSSGNSVSNLTAQNTSKTRAGIARLRAATGTFRVAMVGDSTTVGFDSALSGYTNAKVGSVLNRLATLLTAKGIAAQSDSFFGNGNVGGNATNYNAYNPLVTFPVAGFQPSGSLPGLGGQAFQCTTSGGTLAFTPVSAFDTIDVYYFQSGTAGSFAVNVDGGAALQTINANGTPTNLLKATVTGASLATHTVNIVASSGSPVFIVGIAVRASTVPRVELYNMGVAATTISSYESGSFPFNLLAQLPVVAPDLTFINLTINDINTQVTTVAAYQAAMQLAITAALGSGDVILMIGNPGNTAPWTAGVIAPQYQAAIYALAQLNNLPVLDITQRWVSYAVTNPILPYGDAGAGAVHPGPAGYADIALAMDQALPI